MNVLLTGAFGSIGYETLKQFLELDQYEVYAFDLDNKRNRKRQKQLPKKENIHYIYGNINDEKLVEQIVSKVDVILHLAAIIPPLADQNPELARKVNYYGTKNLLDAIKKKNPKCFLLYASSVSVYGDRLQNPYIKVGDPLNPSEGDYYAYTKIETEKLIQEYKIPYTIFRFTGIMGRPDLDPLMFHMPLDTKMEIATTKDTAFALIRSLEKQKELNGHIYNLSGGEKCRTTYRDFLTHMFQIYGLSTKYLKEIAFAEQNFHCGYFKDGDKLEEILHFRYDTLESYYQRVEAETKKSTRFFAHLFSRPILYFVTKKSEPLRAIKTKNHFLLQRFFKERRENHRQN